MTNLENLRKRRCETKPHTLLLLDSWAGNQNNAIANKLKGRGVKLLKIPEQTTDQLQPLDVTVFRQYKKFIKLMMIEAIHTAQIDMVSTRS